MRRSVVFAVLLAGLAGLSSEVRAQNPPPASPSPNDRAEARRNFQAAVAAYARREFETALGSFQTAFRLAPHPSVRVNMANCFVELRRPAEALANFELFLQESTNVPANQRAAIEQQIQALQAQVAQLTVRVSPSDVMGLAVTLDGQTISTVRPARVGPGRHVVEAFADGYPTVRREIETAARTPAEVSITLERAAPPTPSPSPPVAPAETATSPAPVVVPEPATPVPTVAVRPPPDPRSVVRRSGMRPAAFFAVAGVTVASAVVWGVSGALALSARDDYDLAQQQLLSGADRATSLAARQSAADSMRRLALISDIAMGFTLAGVATSVFLAFRTQFRAPSVDVSATPLPGGGALGINGRF